MNIVTNENRVVINGIAVTLNGVIKKTLVVDSKLLVLISASNLSSTTHPRFNNNVLCFDERARELWIIDNPMLNVDLLKPHIGHLDQWLYLGPGSEWGRISDVATVQSGNWICSINIEDGSLYNCEPFK